VSGSTTIDTVSAANVNIWGYATHKFKFKNTPLSEIFDCLEKSYPYSIKVQNEAIKNCKLTAEFENKSAEYIITLIAETLDLTLTKNGHVFILQGKGCP
jgi:ferric-dicitrate binding protein FerR (iron transport regulator)